MCGRFIVNWLWPTMKQLWSDFPFLLSLTVHFLFISLAYHSTEAYRYKWDFRLVGNSVTKKLCASLISSRDRIGTLYTHLYLNSTECAWPTKLDQRRKCRKLIWVEPCHWLLTDPCILLNDWVSESLKGHQKSHLFEVLRDVLDHQGM